ncbi:muscular LMNA-interacting protein isoform X8 [Hemicordylus capensis]|uniref:muscular LMNA-interacting protein isoform X8 n=1 Tax=Hemicordylus capensis TaxID=884348 RepID=UPI00230278EA|nr:muscular LMNA-interacting protein isoform X8 [Hemicordylus capensis]
MGPIHSSSDGFRHEEGVLGLDAWVTQVSVFHASSETSEIPSESGFLRFTFVPSFGKLPTQFCIADDVTTVQAEAVSESQALRSGNKGNGEATSCTKSSHVHFQPKEPNTIKGRMEANDLFKAEFVFITDSDEDKKATVGNSYGQERSKILDTPYMSTSGKSRREMIDPQLSHTELPHNPASQQQPSQSHKIKTSYKAFAAIPTNTLLLEQKALDEPTKMEGVGEDSDLDTHSEVCSPAQLRQQTEELCAAIDQVLQDPLSMRRCDSSPSSLQSVLDSDIGKISTASQRPGGRKTKFANLNLLAPTVTESQRTKPGVIRPTTVKAKIILKEEEPVQPNPFKKYLEETSDLQMEQDSSLFHPFPHTKLNLSTKSPLHPQFISHADSLTPGPFSHLSSIFGDTHDNSYSPYRRNALYNKPTHPIVPIPENEALSSKELHSAPVHNENDLLPHQENKSLSKGNFRDNGSPSSRAHSLLSREPVDVFAKSSC